MATKLDEKELKIIEEANEEIALARAIDEGLTSEPATQAEVFEIIEGVQ